MASSVGPEPIFELIRKAQLGDAQAFGAAMERYGSRLRALIGLRLGKRLRLHVELDETLQEVRLQAFRSIAQFRWVDQGSFFRWLADVARCIIRKRARRHFEPRKRDSENGIGERPSRSVHELDTVHAVDDVPPLQQLLREDRLERLERALRRIGARSSFSHASKGFP